MKKVVYLFGAGATHAELLSLQGGQSHNWLEENGLLISKVSKRVITEAQNDADFKQGVEAVTNRKGPVNIELLISLFESNQIPNGETKVRKLKELVEADIKRILSSGRIGHFYLHKSFFELHERLKMSEELVGIITLNYDNLLDIAYKTVIGKRPNYCHTIKEGDGIPLLKLHGSFNWSGIKTYGKSKDISILPLGINKNYLNPPYNFIWGRAFSLLTQCDVLRVIGCSLNPNDIGLIDLLFKAHIERGDFFDIEIINSQEAGEKIQWDYGFFPKIIKPKEIEDGLLANDAIYDEAELGNPFKIWIRRKAEKIRGNISNTRFIKKCFDS